MRERENAWISQDRVRSLTPFLLFDLSVNGAGILATPALRAARVDPLSALRSD